MGEGRSDEASDKEVGVSLVYQSWCAESRARHHINDPLENVDWETEVMIAASAALAPTPTTIETHFYI